MNKNVIVPILLAILVTSILVTSEIYLGPILSIRFAIVQQPAVVYGAYLNLGNLTPGEYGNASISGTINVYKPGVYNLSINPVLGEAFSQYTITLSLTNST
ncbi:hypothetical protein DJ529_11440, partial [Sulfolobus sp. C3]